MAFTPAEEAANLVWGLARDLAAPSESGTSLNSERQTKLIAAVIETMAHDMAKDMREQTMGEKVSALRGELATAKKQLKKAEGTINERPEQVA